MEVRVDNYNSSAPCGSLVGSTQQICNNYCDAQALVLARCHAVVALIIMRASTIKCTVSAPCTRVE